MPVFLKPLTSVEEQSFVCSLVYFVFLCFLILKASLLLFPPGAPDPALSALTKHGVRFKCSDTETIQDATVSSPSYFPDGAL